MARYTDASCRLCRREGEKLFLKGSRCYTDKCAVSRRKGSAPGQHGQARKKQSEYGLQLREKQKTKRFYGILEGQFHSYYLKANSKKGITGENLLFILESRLDNTVYRMGLATSRAEARQFVTHEHFLVNGKKVNVPSYLVKVGDVISLRDKSRSSSRFDQVLDMTNGRVLPSWLEFDSETFTGKVVASPNREEVDAPVKEHLIVELYSK